MSTPLNSPVLLPGPPSLAASVRARRSGAVPGLRYREVAPADPEKAAEVDRRLEEWARGLDLFPAAWDGDFAEFQVGRAVPELAHMSDTVSTGQRSFSAAPSTPPGCG
ncbi:hypothetical protein ACWD25_46590, partial [Streptomyces sp. NPDC002920]